MNTKDRFMIRGGGLLWIALFIGFLISYVAILITMLNLIIAFEKFTLLNVLTPFVITILILFFFGCIFSYVEINRISLLKKYDRYAHDYFDNFIKAQKIDYSSIEESFHDFTRQLAENSVWQKSKELDASHKKLLDNIIHFRKEYIP